MDLFNINAAVTKINNNTERLVMTVLDSLNKDAAIETKILALLTSQATAITNLTTQVSGLADVVNGAVAVLSKAPQVDITPLTAAVTAQNATLQEIWVASQSINATLTTTTPDAAPDSSISTAAQNPTAQPPRGVAEWQHFLSFMVLFRDVPWVALLFKT